MVVAGGFLIGFLWAVRKGQYDDHYSPSVRILFDDDELKDQKEIEIKNIEEAEKEAKSSED